MPSVKILDHWSRWRNLDSQTKRGWSLFPILCFAWLFYALDGAVIQVLMSNENFKQTFDLTPYRLGIFGLMPAAGALVSTVGFGVIIPRYIGRKWSFQVATLCVCLGVVLQTFPNKWGALVIGRLIMGFGGDLNGLVLGYYVTESAPKNVRGRSLILVQQFASSFIAIAGFWVAYALAYLDQTKAYSWKVANSIQFVPAAFFFALVFFLPESPRWLAAKHPNDDLPMLKSLSWLRGKDMDHPEVTKEAREIREYHIWAAENVSLNPLNILMNKSLLKRLFFAMIPLLQQQLCGAQILQIYATIVYQSLGLSSQKNALLLTACTQILYAIGALMSSYFVEKLGRRTCIMSASYIWIINLAILSGLAAGYAGETNKIANGFVVAFIILNNFVYWMLATGPTVVYVNEIMPTHARELGVGLANAIPIGINVALGQKWPFVTAKIGAYSYLILLGTCCFGTVLCYIFLKEPKGLSIERIDVLFGEKDHVEEVEEIKGAVSNIEHIEKSA